MPGKMNETPLKSKIQSRVGGLFCWGRSYVCVCVFSYPCMGCFDPFILFVVISRKENGFSVLLVEQQDQL